MKRKFTKWHKKGLGAVFAFAVTLCTGLLASGQTAYASTIYTDTCLLYTSGGTEVCTLVLI